MKTSWFQVWLEYFEINFLEQDGIEWGRLDLLTDAEKAAVGRSVATFQLGESSDGECLRRSAEAYAERFGLAHLPRITRLFIRDVTSGPKLTHPAAEI